MNYDSIFAILHMFKEVKGARFAPDKDVILISLWDSDKEVEVACELLQRNSSDPYKRVQLIEEILKKENV